MIQKYNFGKPFNTESTVVDVENSHGKIPFGKISSGKTFEWNYKLKDSDIVYGLGETMRGMNLRGGLFTSWCLDQPHQNECTPSLYGAHNFVIIFGKETFGIFFDYPGEITFDIGFT